MDSIEYVKARAVANFNLYRRVAVPREILEMLVVVSLLLWSSAKVIPCFFSHASHLHLFEFSSHSVFLLGNAIVILLLTIHRLSGVLHVADSEFPAAAGKDVEICNGTDFFVYDYEEEKNSSISQTENLKPAIRTATEKMERFRRTESEKLGRDISLKTLRISKTTGGGIKFDVEDLERLSDEEFERAIDLFIRIKKIESSMGV